ncbi:hypothetical protein OROGR_028423 [Orobanche gracilis]
MQASIFKLPYRYIFAVATLNSLYVYDTERREHSTDSNYSCSSLTDVAWSPAGNYLALSSQDGYCTLLEFENQELGSPISLSEERKVIGDANTSPVPEAIKDNRQGASIDIGNGMVENFHKEKDDNKDERHASPSARVHPGKAAKRRITPMAVD